MPKISNIGTPTSPTIYTKKYGAFRGVDFSQSETMVDDSHSPHAVNVISDTGGFPEKRLGWRTLKTLDGRVNGIYHYKGVVTQEAETDGEEDTETLVECFVIHAGTKMYSWSGSEEDEPLEILSGINDAKSMGKYFKGKLCILTGEEYLVFDGEKCVRAGESEDVYSPITLMSRHPMQLSSPYLYNNETFDAWDEQGVFKHYTGTAVYRGVAPADVAVNLLSGKRTNTFNMTTNGYLLFALDSPITDGTRVTMKCISTGQEMFSVVYNSGWGLQLYRFSDAQKEGVNADMFEIMSISASHLAVCAKIGNSKVNNCGYVICSPKTSALDGYEYIAGKDNFSIEFTHEYEGYAERIDKCRVLDVFENRVFFSGNPDYPHVDWYSGVNDPLYVPDINYTEIGMDSSRIMGYLRTGSEQAILKNDGADASIYMRSYSTLSDGSVIFPIKQGTSGIGAISAHAICTMFDDPLYLSRNGVYAIAQQDISSERALNIRSTRINKKLLKNMNLEDAYMCTWKGNLILFINGECYVADAAQKTYAGNKTGTFEYEWYYWTNIPARAAFEHEGVLYFGTEDGRVCRFNDDMKNSRGETEPRAYSDDGEAIIAEWATNLSDDGDFMRLKTMKKKGSGVMLKTYNRSGVKVCIKTDRDFEREILEKSAGIFNFEDLDFNDFTFNTSEYTVVPFNAKFKKYKAIQVICRNDKVNQAFGVLGIIRRYVTGNFAK